MSAKQMDDPARFMRPKSTQGAGTTVSATTAICLLMTALLSHGCSSPPPSADQSASTNPDQWPCDPAALDSPHCRLQAIEGFERRADPGALRFENPELAATLRATIIRGPDGAGADDQARQVMAAWQARLSPAVTWDQDPQGPVGFEVRGISGSEPSPLTADPEQQPQHFHVVSYRNPSTGSILLLEASAAQRDWKQVWSRLAPVFAEVRLTEAF